MIYTDSFVFVHLPKTGGTFVRTILQGVADRRRDSASLLGRAADALRGRPFDPRESTGLKHFGPRHIPVKHAAKRVVSCIRNPFDRLVSQYEFKWWVRHADEIAPKEALLELYPHFPDLSFEEWYRMHDRFTLTEFLDDDGRGPGLQSRQFVEFFARDLDRATEEARDGRLDEVRASIADVHFLHTETLNRDLFDLLAGEGLPEAWLEGILESDRIPPPEGGRSKEQTWERYYSPEFFEEVRERERLALELFPEYDRPLGPVV